MDTDRTMCPVVNSASKKKMSTRDSPGGKGGQCVQLTTYHPCSAECQEIRGLNLPGPPWAILTACCGRDNNNNIYIYIYIRAVMVMFEFNQSMLEGQMLHFFPEGL